MSLLRRSATVLSGLLLLQLALLGSGTLCAMHRHATHVSPAPHSMHGATGDDAMRMSPTDSNDKSQTEGCGLPWAPGQCASMTTCTVTVAQVASADVPIAVRAAAVALRAPEMVHSGPTFAPELPPPRA
jgi:hypothetical protein